MRSEDWPCREGGKDCEARHPGCQSKCMKMLAAQLVADKERKTAKAATRKRKDVVGVLTEDAEEAQAEVTRVPCEKGKGVRNA